MSDSPIATVADEATAKQSFFEKGVAVDIVAKTLDAKNGTTTVLPLARIRTKFKPEGAESWQESQWFKRQQVVALRGLCDQALAEMDAITPAADDTASPDA